MFMIHITSKWIYVSNKLMYELVRFSGLTIKTVNEESIVDA